MGCNKFEESGLLYVSGELNEKEAREYESHLEGCVECRRETEEYKRERAQFYGADTLGAVPSAAVDAEILRVCSDPKKTRAAAFTPMMFIKKYAPVPILLMLVMVAVGGYVRYHSMNAEDLRATLEDRDKAPAIRDTAAEFATGTGAAETELAGADGQELAQIIDSLNDSSAVNSAKTKGNINMKGVVTVKDGREVR